MTGTGGAGTGGMVAGTGGAGMAGRRAFSFLPRGGACLPVVVAMLLCGGFAVDFDLGGVNSV